ncbi:hypothetical protein EDB84DRAFT_1439158 [Lactarius hengduanensis]|nr:hypothetical protein EDB84DRAFT_1439158 [Lactarius hengduanensis]
MDSKEKKKPIDGSLPTPGECGAKCGNSSFKLQGRGPHPSTILAPSASPTGYFDRLVDRLHKILAKSQAKSTNLWVQGVRVFSGTGAGSHGSHGYENPYTTRECGAEMAPMGWGRRGVNGGCVETAPVRVEVRDAGGSVVVGSGGSGHVEVAAAWWGRGGSRSRVSEVEGCRSNVEVPGQGRGAAHADAGVVVLRLQAKSLCSQEREVLARSK